MKYLLLLSVIFLFMGCAKEFEINLMPAPEVFVEQQRPPVPSTEMGAMLEESIDGDAGVDVPGLLYVTSRRAATPRDAFPFYADSNDFVLHTGVARIAFTDTSLTVADLQEASNSSSLNGKYKLVVSEVTPNGTIPGTAHPLFYSPDHEYHDSLGDATFRSILRRRVASSPDKSITVFTHGFRVGFTYPVLVASQFHYFDGLSETYIAFSWPSGSRRYLGYFKDSETAIASGRNFRKLIEYLALYSGAKEINIIGHSAGTRVLLEAMNQLALINKGSTFAEIQEKYKINKVLLLSGDATMQQLFGDPKNNVFRMAEKVVLYQSDDDLALKTSQRLQKHRRVGQAFSGASPEPRDSLFVRGIKSYGSQLEIINASDAEGVSKGVGHSYFWTSPWVSSDLIMLLRYKRDPAQRGLVFDEEWGSWEFSDSYPELLKRSIEK